MSQTRLQEYFDENPVRRLTRGSQSVVYGTNRVVVKELRLDLPSRLAARKAKVTGTDLDPMSHLVSIHRDAREALAGLAVPFEMPGPMNLRLARLFGERELKLDNPVIQVRTMPFQDFDVRLSVAVKSGDIEEVRRLLKALIQLNLDLRERNFFVGDAIASNYIVESDGSLRIQDIGAMMRQGVFLDKAMRVREKTAANCIFSVRLRLGSVMSAGVAGAFEDFKREFMATYLVKGVRQDRRRRRRTRNRMPENII